MKSGSGKAELELPGEDKLQSEKREENESGTAERGMPSENEWNTEKSDSARCENPGGRSLDGDRDESPREPES